MRPFQPLLTAACVACVVMLGCGRSEQPTAGAQEQTDGQAEQAAAETSDREPRVQSIVGALRTVDLDNRLFTVVTNSELYLFEFPDATEVVGTPNVRGLTGNTGDRVTVLYRPHPITSTKTAVRIEVQ